MSEAVKVALRAILHTATERAHWTEDDLDGWVRQLEAARVAAGAGDLQEPCSVCVGRPLASGRECICGGIGTALAETQGLRERVADLEIALGFWPNIPPQTSKAYAEVSGAGDRLRLWPAASGPSAAGGAP